jgi:N-acyl-D-amino-acid deacylase
MLSAPGMAPKVSQGVTTVVAGNCGVSLAPGAQRHALAGGRRPLDLLDGDGSWFRFRRFADYVESLGANPPATNCALLVGHTSLRVQTMDDLQGTATQAEREEMRRLADEALAAGRDRHLHGPLLRARSRRLDRRGDRGLPSAQAARRDLLHPHARRGRGS